MSFLRPYPVHASFIKISLACLPPYKGGYHNSLKTCSLRLGEFKGVGDGSTLVTAIDVDPQRSKSTIDKQSDIFCPDHNRQDNAPGELEDSHPVNVTPQSM